jgi:hypothetical protein
MKLNWTRGLVRAWIVVATAWVLLIGIGFWPDAAIKTLFKESPPLSEVGAKSISEITAPNGSAAPKGVAEAEVLRSAQSQIGRGAPLSSLSHEELLALRAQLLARNQQERVTARQQARNDLGEFALWLFGFPLLILGLGAVSRWALLGFAPDS